MSLKDHQDHDKDHQDHDDIAVVPTLDPRSGATTAASSGSPEPLDEKAPAADVDADDGTVRESAVTKEIDEGAVFAFGEDKVTLYVWALISTAAISGLLFGYDTGTISGALVSIGSDLGPAVLSNTQKELITSSTTLGALIGGLGAGVGSDVVGRKWVLGVANLIFIGGAIGQAVSYSVGGMIAGRFVIGLGVGIASCIAPLYIGELSPTVLRGRCVTINVVAITLGQVVAYAIGAAFAHATHGWRYMVGLGAAPAILSLGALYWLPESPRILIRHGKEDQARVVLSKMYASATADQLEGKLGLLCASVDQGRKLEQGSTFWTRLAGVFTVATNRRALIIGCGLQAFQQLCGFNTLMYYSATLFKAVGFDNATAVGLIITAVNFVFTLVALRIVDPIGRRRIMVWSAPGMIVSLVLASVSFHFLTRKTSGELLEGSDYPKQWSALVLVWMVTYVASYAIGLGNIPWLQGELFRLEVRGIGTSLCTATNWGTNLLIGATFLSLMDAITPSGAFGLYAGLCLLGWLFCLFFYPETSGLSLEEVFHVFENDSFAACIKRSEQIRAQKRARVGEIAQGGQAA